jgi:hypothetical protein
MSTMMKNKKSIQSQVELTTEAPLTSTEEKLPVIGQFKPKRKFINFITGLKGRIRLLSNHAFIKGEQLSGMLEGVVFKVTICDEGSINFEEVDSNLSTPQMIQNFIDEIDSRDVTGYTKKFVVTGLDFYDDENKPCYLEVEHKKPIDTLFSLFEEDETLQVSESGMSILDALFSSETDEELDRELECESDEEIQLSRSDVNTIIKNVEQPPQPNTELKNAAQRYMEENFKRLNDEKVVELKSRIDRTEQEILKLQHEIKQSETKLDSTKENLRILNTRLNSLSPKDEPIGYCFFVSAEIKSDIEPDQNLLTILDKIAPVMKLNVPVVVNMLTGSHFNIKIKSIKGDDKISKEIVDKISKIDVTGSITMLSHTEYEYRGELNWHQLVDRMIRLGFEQNPDFDKECGSNSYQSEESEEQTENTDI